MLYIYNPTHSPLPGLLLTLAFYAKYTKKDEGSSKDERKMIEV